VQFSVLPPRSRPASPHPGEAFLVRDNWDDFHFKTTFELLCVDSQGEAAISRVYGSGGERQLVVVVVVLLLVRGFFLGVESLSRV
jgi:hypothetical protein